MAKAWRCWHGWAVDLPGRPLYVQYGGTEETAWMFALGWPTPAEIVWWRHKGARAFPVEITEAARDGNMAPRRE